MRTFRLNAAQSAALALVTCALAAAAPVRADDVGDVMQIKQAFDPGVIEVKTGTTLSFLNADDVNHNLQAVDPTGAKTDYGLEKPGQSTKIAFASVGTYAVVCAIHPRMKMKVIVKDEG